MFWNEVAEWSNALSLKRLVLKGALGFRPGAPV